jgi:hypothetical protein
LLRDPDFQYGSGSTKSQNLVPIRIRIHNPELYCKRWSSCPLFFFCLTNPAARTGLIIPAHARICAQRPDNDEDEFGDYDDDNDDEKDNEKRKEDVSSSDGLGPKAFYFVNEEEEDTDDDNDGDEDHKNRNKVKFLFIISLIHSWYHT